jgi:preprotein translocase subunit SecA
VVEEIRQVHVSGRPVLVGTLTVEESERFASRLCEAGVACEILNAKNDAREARVIARAGVFGAVTMATNMAGRGTDIVLGGEDEAYTSRPWRSAASM